MCSIRKECLIMQKIGQSKRTNRVFDLLMIGIPTAFFVALYLLPCIAGLFFSLTDFGGYSLDLKFVGLRNYKKLMNDTVFFKSILNYFKLYFGVVLVCFPLAYTAALALTKNRRIKERNIYRILFFFPNTVPTLIIAIMWMTMYNPTFGVLNQVITSLGGQAVQWLGSSKVAMISVIIVVIWRIFGFYLVYFMAGVSNVPMDLYESARIDGASEFIQTVKITIPLTWDVIRTSMLFFIMTAMNVGFGTVYVLTQGGPDNSTQVISSYLYQNVTKYLEYGLGSAIGVVMMLITAIMSLIILKTMKRDTYEM